MSKSPAKVYSLQVSGISCTNCAANIIKILNQGLNDPDTKVTVNVLNEKITLTVLKDEIIDKVKQLLKDTKYKPIGQAMLISGNRQNQRNICFVIDQQLDISSLEEQLAHQSGIIKKDVIRVQDNIKIKISYDSAYTKGRQIGDIIQKYDQNYRVINQRVNSLKKAKKHEETETSLKLTISLIIYFLLAYMIFPILPSFKTIYNQCISFPQTFGIYSISVLFNICLTIYVINVYAKPYILRAFQNYIQFGTTNMETLIALGSVSACALSIFFLVRYTVEQIANTLQHPHMAIMDINHALTSASIIVLVVTVGKELQKKVKQKITKMADELFPQSVLFSDMSANFVNLKNRKLNILSSKCYDVSLLQKDDIVSLHSGILLVDAIVISGNAKVTQSARTGSQQVLKVTKGDRIESGATVHSSYNCLVQVQNVIEKSLLIQVATHVKFSQNQDGQGSAIETLCKRIADYFVKGVILLSLVTMTVWALILIFKLTTVPVCDICWIIQRGIGVLVASCPCALGLAIPSVIANILNMAIKSGILIKRTSIFEKIKDTKVIAFDKTGTLFTRINQIEGYKILNRQLKQEQIWQILAILQKDFRHPLAEILYRQAFTRSQISGTNFSFIVKEKELIQGKGIVATLVSKNSHEDVQVCIGNVKLFHQNKIDLQNYEDNHQFTAIYVAINRKASIVIYMNTHSNLRPEAQKVINQLKLENMDVHILSGDTPASVINLGNHLGIPQSSLHADKTAIQKVDWVRNEQKELRGVVMVGDGLNDIPCLKEASVGISINAKSQLNINAADAVILSQNLHKIVALIRFLRRGNLFIKINLFWAFAYNIIIMPVVAGVLFPFDIFVSPIWSAVAMSCSSLLVVAFSHLLTYLHYDDSLNKQTQVQEVQESGVDLSGSNREVLTLNQEIS